MCGAAEESSSAQPFLLVVSSFQNFLGVVIDSQIDLGTECYGKLTVCLSIPRSG